MHASYTDIQSLANSLTKLGHEFAWVQTPEDIMRADVRGDG